MSGAMLITLNDGTTQMIDADNFRGLLTELGTLIAIECQKARRGQRADIVRFIRETRWVLEYDDGPNDLAENIAGAIERNGESDGQ